MTKKEAQALVDECFEPMARAMGVWNPDRLACHVYKKGENKNWTMNNVLSTWYNKSIIKVYAIRIYDREDFLRDIRHELLHLNQIGFAGFCQTIMQIVPDEEGRDPPGAWNALDQQWRRDFENDMVRLENMMDSLGMTGKKILAIGKRMMKLSAAGQTHR